MNAADIMTRTVVSIAPTASIIDAMRLMTGQHLSGLPVMDADGRLVGIITEGDLLRRVEMGTERAQSGWRAFLRGPALQAQDYVHSHGRRVEDVMTRDVLTVTGAAQLTDVVGLMETRHIKRLPVVADGRLLGVISRADLLRVLIGELSKTMPALPDDQAMREKVMDELRAQTWGGRTSVTVLVTNGVVFLEGTTFDERERDAIRVLAENVPGVREVRDHLAFCDPSQVMIYG